MVVVQSDLVQDIRKVGVGSDNNHSKKPSRKISQNHLGWLYQNGYGVEKDYSLAFDYYKEAADQNDVKAQNNLGYMYEHGLGVAENATLAIEWYAKSANQGYAEAQYNLGYMYEIGNGIPKNIILAIEWYKKSAAKGNPEAQYSLGLLYENGDGVTEEIEIALDWYKKSAAQQNADAQYRLGLIFDKGFIGTEDVILAVKWYEKAAAQGHEEAQYSLGTLYEDGRGVPENKMLAKMWYQKSAAQGHKLAQLKLNEDVLIHKFNYSLMINNQFYNNYEDICYINCPESIVLTITYVGTVDIGNNIIISEKINNPYQDLSQQVTTACEGNKYYSDCSKIINDWCNCILSCFGISCSKTSDNTDQDKLDAAKIKSNRQFWKQTIEGKLKEAEYLVDKIIEQKRVLEVCDYLNIEGSLQRLAIQQPYDFPGTCNINNSSDLSVQSVQYDSKDCLVLPKKDGTPLKFRSPIFNRYRYG